MASDEQIRDVLRRYCVAPPINEQERWMAARIVELEAKVASVGSAERCADCGEPAVGYLDDFPVCEEHWAEEAAREGGA